MEDLLKTKKEYKLKNQEIRSLSIKINQIKLAFNMTWLIEVLMILERMASDKVLRDKTLKLFKNPKYDRYQCRLASIAYKFLEKKETSGGAIKSEIMIFLICN